MKLPAYVCRFHNALRHYAEFYTTTKETLWKQQ